MELIGLGKVTKVDGVVTERVYVAELTEKEFDKITGIAGKPHNSGRYKVGRKVNISKIYDKVKMINDKHAEIKAAVIAVKASADSIDNSIPLT